MSEALKIPSAMTLVEFLAWNAPGPMRWQLIDGVPVAMAPASRTHAAIQNEAGRLIGNHLAALGNHCSVLTTPGVVPRMRAHDNFRIPDLAVTCTPYAQEEYDVANPVLIIEILSPSNKAETWTNVWAYASLPSVQEILVLDSTSIAADLLRRGPDGAWPTRAVRIVDGDVALASIDFAAPLTAFYRITRLV